MDPTDGRAYVSLGKLLLQQKRIQEARKLYDDGAAATGRVNAVCMSCAEGQHVIPCQAETSYCAHMQHDFPASVLYAVKP